MGSYNRQKAVYYACRYALMYNSNWFDDRGSAGGGGDCTNFISQCLYAGGWEMVSGAMGMSWWADVGTKDRSRRSPSWGGAGAFQTFLWGGLRAKECEQNEVQLGDLIQEVRNDTAMHTMIITGLFKTAQGSKILYSCHTADRLSRPFDLAKPVDSESKFIFWKMRDEYAIVGEPYDS